MNLFVLSNVTAASCPLWCPAAWQGHGWPGAAVWSGRGPKPPWHYVGCKRHLGYPWRSRGHPSFNGAQALVTHCPSSCGFKMSQSCSTSSYQGNSVFCLFLVFGFFWGLFWGCCWVLSAHPQSTSTWRCSQECFMPTGIASASKMSAKPY